MTSMTTPNEQSSREQELRGLLREWQQAYNRMDDVGVSVADFQSLRRRTHEALSSHIAITAEEAGREGDGWLPIDSAPIGKQMLVVQAFDVTPYENGRKYTSDPYCVWQPVKGHFERWPHPFDPTHYMKLLPAPAQSGGQG